MGKKRTAVIICMLLALLAGCGSVPEPIPCQEITEGETLPELPAPMGGVDLQVLSTWSAGSCLAISEPYQYLGNGGFYCYPDADHYGDGTYYQYDWQSNQIAPLEVQYVEQMTPLGQVRFRWWIQNGILGIHNISDQQLQNDFSLEASLAYASVLPNTSSRVLLTQGAGTGGISLATLDLQTGAVEALSTGAAQTVQEVSCNASATRFLLRLEDGTFSLGDGQTAQPLQALTGTESPITQAYWSDSQQEDQIFYITEEQSERKSAWVYDCISGKTTLLLENYLEYQGIPGEQEEYVLVNSEYALRRMPDGTTYLMDLLGREARKLQDFTWETGIFWGSMDNTALFLVRGEQGLEVLGLLDCQEGSFQVLHRQPVSGQLEAFDLLHFDRRTIGLPAQDTVEQPGVTLLYVYKF